MTDAAGKSSIDLTANIVSAYLSNNPTPASEIPNLISQVHAALLRVSSGRAERAARAGKARGVGEEVDRRPTIWSVSRTASASSR